jgi:hypothetical protein
MQNTRRQRIYAALLSLGACILLFRTLAMLWAGALEVLMPWVSALLLLEMTIDIAVLATAIRWWVAASPEYDSTPLRLGAAAALLHAFRVLIFALGRVEPFLNFDVRPEHWAEHGQRWAWSQVWFASTLSVLGVIGVLVIWWLRRRSRLSKEPPNQ